MMTPMICTTTVACIYAAIPPPRYADHPFFLSEDRLFRLKTICRSSVQAEDARMQQEASPHVEIFALTLH